MTDEDAIKKAILARDWEWWEILCGVDGVEPEPEYVKKFLLDVTADFVVKPLTDRIAELEKQVSDYRELMRPLVVEHITDGRECWCSPDKTPDGIVIHRQSQ